MMAQGATRIAVTQETLTSPRVAVCRECVHFRRVAPRQPRPGHAPSPDADVPRCAYFKTLDVVTGVVEHAPAQFARLREEACGMDGRAFRRKTEKTYTDLIEESCRRSDEQKQNNTSSQTQASDDTTERNDSSSNGDATPHPRS